MTPYRIKRHRKRTHRRQPHDAGAVHRHADDPGGVPAGAHVRCRRPAEHQEHHHSGVVSEKKPRPTVVVMITKEELLVNGRAIATLRSSKVINAEMRSIQPLKARVEGQAGQRARPGARKRTSRIAK